MLSDRTPPKWIPRLVTFMQDKNLRSNMRVLPALETVLDTPCHVLQIDPNMNKRFKLKTKIWFASDKSMLALRFLCTDPNGKVFEEISTQKIASVETKNGVIWYPVLAKRYKSFPMTSRIESTKIEVKALESKVTFDKSVFKSTFPRGTRVIDRIHSVVYVTGMDDVDQVGAIQQLKK
jgi:hypothetical protein